MRKSRVLLAGVAVAGAAVTTSAFTASNDVPASIAGYDEAVVSGATVTSIEYTLDGADASLVDSIEFEATENVFGMQAILQLSDGDGDPVGGQVTCTVSAYSVDHTPISCAIPDQPIAAFEGIALTIAQ
jgi:hypothetical protein